MIYLNLLFIPVNAFIVGNLIGKTKGWVLWINVFAVAINLFVIVKNLK